MNTHNHDIAESMVSGATATSGGMTEGATGVEIATASLKFHSKTLALSKSHKTSPVLANLLYHLDMKTYCIVIEKG
jgi:hypothetical protein